MSFIQIITYTGIFIFAISGALKARTFKMDVFGGIVIAFVTAYGGGTLRDLLIGVKPVPPEGKCKTFSPYDLLYRCFRTRPLYGLGN